MLRTDLLVPSTSTKPANRAKSRYRSGRRGFTLLEVMIATAVTLLMMLSLAQIFKVIGDSMKQGRAVLELNNRLRNVVYRIRTDLDNLTVVPRPPTDPSQATGYFQVYDGPTTDFTAASQSTAHSRFGDCDDIFMATARAGDVWFTGKVPQYMLAGVEPTSTADFQLVSIASQHAEIAIFLQPLVTNVGNPNRDPNFFLTSTPNGALAFQDSDGFVGFPDGFRLYYRTFLIRPDLNLASPLAISAFGGAVAPAGVLPAGQGTNSSGQPVTWTVALPMGSGIPSPLCDMAVAHQQCDLSVRRVFNPGDGLSGTNDFIAANSLEDLVDPANRFAHVQVPLPGTSSTSMSLLALGPKLTPTFSATNPYAPYPDGALGTANFEIGCGFLHPAFTLQGSRVGEDVLSSDILAFDIKLFDDSVPLIRTVGSDGVDQAGAAGSDDLVLSPNDPGYAVALGLPAAQATVEGSGDYVDLAWAKKLVAHGGSISATTNVWSALSGYSLPNFLSSNAQNAYSDALYKSGAVLRSGTATFVLQPSFDTWTTRYEGDGILQSYLGTTFGNVRISGANSLYGISGTDLVNAVPAWRQSAIDAATDGIDNNPPPGPQTGVGVDDVTEFETAPPFPVDLRGLKIYVRMEDPITRQVKQMSVAKEFVTQ